MDACYVAFPHDASDKIRRDAFISNNRGEYLISCAYLVPINRDGSYTAAGLERVDDARMR